MLTSFCITKVYMESALIVVRLYIEIFKSDVIVLLVLNVTANNISLSVIKGNMFNI